MGDISLISAGASVKGESLKMIEDFYSIDGYPFIPKKAELNFKEIISSDHLGKFWLIKKEAQTIGYIILAFGYSFEYGGRDALIDEFFIKEPYRGEGLGTVVLKQVEQKAKKLGVNAIHLEVENTNQAGNRLYLQSGFSGNNRSLLTKKLKQ